MRNSIIITAGGIGKRMLADEPKQFLLLAGKPIMMHTIEQFYKFDQKMEIIVVLPKDQLDRWAELCDAYSFKISHIVVEGGEERFHSVKNGLASVSGDIVGVHDAVRPLVSLDVIENCFDIAREKGAAIPVVGLKQSIRKITESSSVAEDRSSFKLVQTPQCFSLNVLKKAYAFSYESSFTDDASVVERTGQEIFLVEGNEENIKLTTPFDLKVAALFFA